MSNIIPFPNRGHGEQDARASRFPGLFLKDIGLTDDQIAALISGSRDERATVFTVAPQLRPTDPDAVPVLAQTIGLLQAVAGREPLRATAKGNLPAAMVKGLFAGAFADAEPDYVRVNREDDSVVLSRVRRLTQRAGLLSYRQKRFQLTKVGRGALESDDFNEMYRRLLEAHLRDPGAIAQFDRISVGRVVAETVPFLLFVSRDTTGEYLYEEDFRQIVYAVRDDYRGPNEDLDLAIRIRFFERFGKHFGLFEQGPAFTPPVQIPNSVHHRFPRWRRTDLFDRVFHWHVAPPTLAVQTPETAALDWMSGIHESPYRFDATEDYLIGSICLRAIERCPTDADGYVVLARIYSHRPHVALTFVDAGLAATVGAVPEVPDGVSAWGDHRFRNILRLHFIRAELLRELDRIDDALAEYEELLRVDPLDGIGAREHYFPALVEAGRNEDAQRLVDRFAEDRSAAALWNATLAAYARGDTRQAEARRSEAIEANPNVPEHLLSRWAPEPTAYYALGGVDEAIVYAEQARSAWRHVRGAREWLRKRTSEG